MPTTPESSVADTPVMSPIDIAEMVVEARALKARRVENEKTAEHRALGMVLGELPGELVRNTGPV